MPAPTLGFFGERAGGQFDAHAPEQRLLFFRSCPKAYSVRPFESTRMRPRLEELLILSAFPPAAALAVGAELVAAVALPEPPQPATAASTSGRLARGRRL